MNGKLLTTLLMTLLTIVAVGVTGCGSDEEEQSVYLYNILVPYQPVAKKDLPDWMLSKVEVIEKSDPALSLSKVYQGVWNDDIVYLITDCLREDVLYSKEGIVITKDYSSFLSDSKEWRCIYIIK